MKPLLDDKTTASLLEIDPEGGFLRELVEEFFGDAENSLRALGEAALNGQYQVFRDGCHALRGVGGAVGAERLSALGTEAMNLNEPEFLESGVSYADKLQALYLETHHAFESLLSRFD